jgi:hypothetical protein
MKARPADDPGSLATIGHPGIAAFPNRLINGEPPKERNVQLLGEPLAPAMAEDVRFVVAVGAGVIAHVLDQTHRRDIQLLVHTHRAEAVGEWHLLRRGHDNRADHWNRLAQAERNVTRARRHVDDQVIEIPPCHFAEELLYRAMQHRTTPDDGRVIGGQKTHRHDLKAVLLCRHDLFAVGRKLRRRQTEHDGNVWTVDVSVEDADAAAALGKRERKVHGYGRFADAPLARAHRDDVLDARQRRTSGLGSRYRTDVRRHPHVDGGDARKRAHRCRGLLTQLILHRTRRCRQLDRERDVAVLQREVLDESERHDVAPEVRIVDNAQRVEHGVAFERGGHSSILIDAGRT